MATLFLLGMLYSLLAARRWAPRFVQTALAWMGVDLLFLLLALPILLMLGKQPLTPETVTPQQLVLMWPLLGLLVWKLAVQVFILRNALECRTAAALVIALLLDLGVSVVFGA